MVKQRIPLPFDECLPAFVDAVGNYQTVIVTGPTGTGKSTLGPLELWQRGYNTIVTEPRRLAAMSLPKWTATLAGETLGKRIGYRTAYERCDSPDTSLRYVTDGYQLVRELVTERHKTDRRDVLIIDELHEWNVNQEILIAWILPYLRRHPGLTLVIMSATMDAPRLSKFLGDAPIIEAKGRTFPIEDRKPGESIFADIQTVLAEGQNVLVFLPGKREIRELEVQIKAGDIPCVCLPLHSKLEAWQQELCFGSYDMPKCILATDIAQTSITIPDIDGTIDSARRRVLMAMNGVEGLYTVWTSLADEAQRRGRGGRVRNGFYISHYQGNGGRAEYPMPEIQRRLLEGTMLRVKTSTGLDLESLRFFHQPPRDALRAARRQLVSLECYSEQHNVTQIGFKVAQHSSVAVRLGRIISEAEECGVADDAITIAAIMEAGGILERSNMRWRELYCPMESDSDVLAQLQVFEAVEPLFVAGEEDRLESEGINLKALRRAIEIRKKLGSGKLDRSRRLAFANRRQALLHCIRCGFQDSVFARWNRHWTDGYSNRVLASVSVVDRSATYIAGIAWDLDLEDEVPGENTLHLIHWATRVNKTDVPPSILSMRSRLAAEKRQRDSLRGKDRKRTHDGPGRHIRHRR